MIFPKGTAPKKAFTAEEIYLRDEIYRAQVDHTIKARGSLRLKRADGTWFTAVKDGVLCSQQENWNEKL